jgi:hypothetical protein
MKKQIILLSMLLSGIAHALPQWETQAGFYLINNSQGSLTLTWDGQSIPISKTAHPITKDSAQFIAVKPGTIITVSYSDKIRQHTELHSCRGGAHLEFTTDKRSSDERIVLYEITGGYSDGNESYKRPGTGHHCRIKLNRQRFNAQRALNKYPLLR